MTCLGFVCVWLFGFWWGFLVGRCALFFCFSKTAKMTPTIYTRSQTTSHMLQVSLLTVPCGGTLHSLSVGAPHRPVQGGIWAESSLSLRDVMVGGAARAETSAGKKCKELADLARVQPRGRCKMQCGLSRLFCTRTGITS